VIEGIFNLRQRLTPGFCLALGLFIISLTPLHAAGVEGGGLMDFLRGRTWQFFMEWLNFIVLILLIWNFVIKKLLLPAVDEGLTDIETRLSQEESMRKSLQEEISKIQTNLENLEQEEQVILEEAKVQSEKIREEILESAREQELRIIGQVEEEAAAHFRSGLEELLGRYFSGVTDSFAKGLTKKDQADSVKKYNSNTMSSLGGSHGK